MRYLVEVLTRAKAQGYGPLKATEIMDKQLDILHPSDEFKRLEQEIYRKYNETRTRVIDYAQYAVKLGKRYYRDTLPDAFVKELRALYKQWHQPLWASAPSSMDYLHDQLSKELKAGRICREDHRYFVK